MPAVATEVFPSAQAVIDRMRERPIPGQRVSLRLDAPLDGESFLRWCAEHPEARAELEPDGTITLMTPAGLKSNTNENWASYKLTQWWEERGTPGQVFGPNAGFTLPDGSVRAPDASWISQAKREALSEREFDGFARVVPDFVIEVLSKYDGLGPARQKLVEVWMAAGVQLGWLIAPRHNLAEVYRPGADVLFFEGFDRELSADPVVPGFAFDLRRLVR